MTEPNTLAISEFEKNLQLAEQGDAQAQFHVGLVYTKAINEYQEVSSQISLNEFPYPVKYDDAQAFQWFEKAATQGNTDAQYFLGVCYSKGCGVNQDYAQAVYWHKKAAEQGNRNSQDTLGFYYYSEQDYQQAIDWFKKAAEQGDYFAQYRLACCYRDGIGVEHNNQLTFEWFNKCAENYIEFWQGIFLSRDKLDYSHFYDIELTKDWMCGDIYYRVADCYFNGVGVEVNQKKGFEWLEKAAVSVTGEKYSIPKNVDYLHDKDFLFGITYGEGEKKLIQQWITESKQGKIETQYCLAVAYFEDNHYTDALYFLSFALKNNHPAAHQWLEAAYLHIAFPYLTGRTDAERYYQAAFDYCSNEADQYSNEVGFCLGVLYACGKGVEQNKERASKQFYWVLDNTGYHLDPFCDYDELQLLAEYYLLVTNYYDNKEKDYLEMDKAGNQFLIDYVEAFSEFLAGVLSKSRMLNHPVLPSFTMKVLCEMGSSLSNETGDFDSARKMLSSNRDRMLKEAALLVIDKDEQLYKKNKELEEINKALESEIKEKENANHRMQKLVEQFTHSLGNVIFPDTIYQVAERLKNNPECRKDVLLLHEAYHSEIIIKLQGELLRQRYSNTNPEKFRQFIRSCRRTPNSAENTKSIEDILDYAASRVTARFLNQHYAGLNSIRDKMLFKKNLSLDALKQKFEDDILLNKSLRPIAWINQHLRPVQVTELSPLWKKVCILSESHAEALLFGYFSEILFNAFKYADHDKDEFLTLVFGEETINDKTYLSCSWLNPFKDKSPAMLGTGKGLDAIQEDLKQLNDTVYPEESLLISQQNNQFQVTLFFTKDLLVNDLPSLKIKRKANVE